MIKIGSTKEKSPYFKTQSVVSQSGNFLSCKKRSCLIVESCPDLVQAIKDPMSSSYLERPYSVNYLPWRIVSWSHKISTLLNEKRPTDCAPPLTDLKTIDASKKVKIGEVQEFLYSLPKAWIWKVLLVSGCSEKCHGVPELAQRC